MKNTNEHRALENKLRNKHGYSNIKTTVNKLTAEALITMGSKEDAEEMREVFGEQGYQFGYENH